jgi:hypothetical protein
MKFYAYMWLREDGTPYYVGKGWLRRVHGRHRVGWPPPGDRIIAEEYPDEKSAFEAERFLIAYYGRKDLGTGCLRNRTDGGEGACGRIYKHSQETKNKLKNRIYTDEWRRNMSIAKMGKKTGRKLSESHRAALLNASLGRPKSAEARQKMSAAARLRPPMPESSKQKLRDLWKGRVFSEEHKRKISQGQTARWRKNAERNGGRANISEE